MMPTILKYPFFIISWNISCISDPQRVYIRDAWNWLTPFRWIDISAIASHTWVIQSLNRYLRVHAKSLQSCPTLCDTMNCSPSANSVHVILHARILECVAMPSTRGSCQPRIESTSLMSPALAGGFFTTSTTREALMICILSNQRNQLSYFSLFSFHTIDIFSVDANLKQIRAIAYLSWDL